MAGGVISRFWRPTLLHVAAHSFEASLIPACGRHIIMDHLTSHISSARRSAKESVTLQDPVELVWYRLQHQLTIFKGHSLSLDFINRLPHVSAT